MTCQAAGAARRPARGLAAALALAVVAGATGAAADCTAPDRGAPPPARELRIETPAGAMAATLHAPAGPPRALVVMLHGHTGARDEIPVQGGEGMFVRAARAFAVAGIAALRVDLIGSGDSAGAWADTTFAGQARDARRALLHLRALPGHAGLPAGLLGYSQGGLVALRAAPGAADRVAVWNAVLDPLDTFGLIFGARTLAEGAARHAAGATAVLGDTGLRPAFFAGVTTADPLADAAAWDGPLLLVAGAGDRLARRGPALARAAAARRAAPTEVRALDAGHDLGAVSDPATLDAAIACTAAFLLSPPGDG